MLLATPTEIQLEIISYLDLPSLAQLAQVSHHLHLLATPPLYETVTLRRWSDVRALFALDKALLPKDPELARERGQRRRRDLDCIRRLVIDFPVGWIPSRREDVPSLARPSPLLGLATRPLKLDLLRIAYYDNKRPLVPLLKSVNPQSMELQRCHENFREDSEFNVLLMVGNRVWTRLETLTYGAVNMSRGYDSYGGRSIKSSPFGQVRAILFRAPDNLDGFEHSLEKLNEFCPNLERLTIQLDYEPFVDPWRDQIEDAVTDQVVTEIVTRKGIEIGVEDAKGVGMVDIAGRTHTVWPGDDDYVEEDEEEEEVAAEEA